MTKLRERLALLLILLCAAAAAKAAPVNVILFIGDGMGFEHVQAASLERRGEGLVFEAFPHASRVATSSKSRAPTDSAAAATAMATGNRVNNGVVSLSPAKGGSPLQTILEHMKSRGKATGLVTTTHLTHATPAAFGAHAGSRKDYAKIAGDYLEGSRPEILLGGGGFGLDPQKVERAGYCVILTPGGFEGSCGESDRVAGLFGEGHLPYVNDGPSPYPALATMTRYALDRLGGDPDGFFLMVEGGRIDHASHGNDMERMLGEIADFDEAVAEAVSWAEGKGVTLIIVTADHETGGLKGVGLENGTVTGAWSTKKHTASDVPIYVNGLQGGALPPKIDNTDIFKLQKEGKL